MSRWIIVGNTSPDILYNGSWTPYQGAQFDDMGYFGTPFNSTLHGTASNSSFSFKFKGSVIVYGTQQYNGSDFSTPVANPSWDCVIDGISGPIVEQQGSAFAANNIELCSVSGLADGEHTVTTNAHIVGKRTFWFDYIRSVPSPSVPLDNATVYIDKADPQLQYSAGGCSNFNDVANITGIAGSTLRFNFIGNSVAWYVLYVRDMSTPGTASFSIDGGTPTKVAMAQPVYTDNFGGLSTNQIVLQASSLSQGSHTLEVTYESDDTDISSEPLPVVYLLVQNGTGAGPFISAPSTTTSANSLASSQTSTNFPPAKSHAPIGAAVAGAIGGLVFIAALFIIIWSRRAWRNIPTYGLDPDLTNELQKPVTLADPYTLQKPRLGSTAGVRPLEPATITTPPLSSPPPLSPPSPPTPTSLPPLATSLTQPGQINGNMKQVLPISYLASSGAGIITVRDEDSRLDSLVPIIVTLKL